MLKHLGCQESFADEIYWFQATLLVVGILLLLITFILYMRPSFSSNEFIGDYALANRKMSLEKKSSGSYTAIFDASSSNSHVHLFHFYHNLDLVHIDKDL